MRLPVVSLALGALALFGFGLPLIAAPGLLQLVDLGPVTPTARSDVRAVYGGLEVGLGAFLVLCATRRAWWRPGLVAQALAIGGVVAGRLLSLAVDGVPRPLTFVFWAAELVGAVLPVVALRRLDADNSVPQDGRDGR